MAAANVSFANAPAADRATEVALAKATAKLATDRKAGASQAVLRDDQAAVAAATKAAHKTRPSATGTVTGTVTGTAPAANASVGTPAAIDTTA